MNVKKIISALLAALMLLSIGMTGIVSAAELPFTDVAEGDWFYEAVEYAYENEIMNGTGDGSKFSPNMSLTRAMVATVLYRIEGDANVTYPEAFADVEEGQYYTNAANWAYDSGIVTGTGEDIWGDPLFSPDKNITRQELATMIGRFASFCHVDIAKNTGDINSFPDASSVATWAADTFRWTYGTGIITGKTDGGKAFLAPAAEASRAEFATIINRFCEKDDAREFSYLLAYEPPVPISSYTEKPYPLVKDADIYVAVDGNDNNEGTFEKPLATLAGAKAAVRELKQKKTEGEIKVAFMAGSYAAPVNLAFTADDSGSDKLSITYCAYGDGDVVFNAGATIPVDSFEPIGESEKAMFPAEFVDEIKKVDLSEVGIDSKSLNEDNAVFLGKERLDLARWPNRGENGNDTFIGHMNVTDVDSEAQTMILRANINDRVKTYHNIDEMYMLGYFSNDWSYSKGKVTQYDAESGLIKPPVNHYGLAYWKSSDIPHFFFYNIPDELDCVDEYYIDVKTNQLYMISPNDDLNIAMTGDMITINDCSHMSFVNMTFCYSSGTVVHSRNSHYLTFDRFDAHNIRAHVLNAIGDYLTVTSCEFYDIGAKTITMTSGDRNTLRKGGSVIENCLFDHFGSVDKTGNPAIYVTGCGITIAHNELCNSPNIGIFYSEYIWASNYITVEYNYLHNVVTQTSDSGAIYSGRNVAGHGSIVRYNLIVEPGDYKANFNPHAIYLDDYMSGQDVYGNLIYSTRGSTIFMHGGRENKIHGNVWVTTDNLGYSPFLWMNDEGYTIAEEETEGFTKPYVYRQIFEILELVPFRSEIWAEHFPNVAKYVYDMEYMLPYINNVHCPQNSALNEVYDNHMITNEDTLDINILENFSDNVKKWATNLTPSTLYSLDENPMFVDPTHGDYTIREGVDIDIPFEKMGRY